MSARSPKDTKRQQPPQPQSAHPAAIWQKIQKYHLLYHQTVEQLNSRGCEIPELILYTPLSTIDTAGLKDSTPRPPYIKVSSYTIIWNTWHLQICTKTYTWCAKYAKCMLFIKTSPALKPLHVTTTIIFAMSLPLMSVLSGQRKHIHISACSYVFRFLCCKKYLWTNKIPKLKWQTMLLDSILKSFFLTNIFLDSELCRLSQWVDALSAKRKM